MITDFPSPLCIRSRSHDYTVTFGSPPELIVTSESDILVLDANIADLHRDRLPRLSLQSALVIDATEAAKSLDQVPYYVARLLELGATPQSRLTAVGGGVTLDITAFLAGVLFRGVAWRAIPTTLLAQADSCIGGKSSLNVGSWKNQVGTFTPPTHVQIDPEFLQTLDDRAIRSGRGEILKAHLLAGPAAWEWLVTHWHALRPGTPALLRAVYQSLQLKQRLIEADEFDHGTRCLLNYGHTFGHAIESATDFALPHGLAVTMGIDMANHVAWRLGQLAEHTHRAIHEVLAENLQGDPECIIDADRFFAAMQQDKKRRNGQQALVLLQDIGQAHVAYFSFDQTLQIWCAEYLERYAGGFRHA